MRGVVQMPGQWQHLAAVRQQLAHQTGGGLPAAVIVHTDKAESLAARNI